MTRTSAPVSRAATASASSLGVEQVGPLGREPEAATPEGRVLLGPEVGELQRLVGAGVEGAHDDASSLEGREDAAVDLGLLLDRRGLGRREVDELGAEEPDALEVQGSGGDGVLDAADVGEQRDVGAVGRATRTGEVRQRLGAARGPLPLGGHEGSMSGSIVTSPVSPSSATGVPAAISVAPASLDDGGDPHLRGEDRRVARAAAGLGDDADDEAPVERRRLGGREVLGDDDAGLGEGGYAGGRDPEHRCDGA